MGRVGSSLRQPRDPSRRTEPLQMAAAQPICRQPKVLGDGSERELVLGGNGPGNPSWPSLEMRFRCANGISIFQRSHQDEALGASERPGNVLVRAHEYRVGSCVIVPPDITEA